MSTIGDYNEIISDRNLFNKVVYTPLSEALKILEERRNNPELVRKIEELLKGDIPEILKKNKCGVQFRQIATPNHDTRHFISITKDNNLTPVLFEYHEDKFTSNNVFKHSLGQLKVYNNVNKKGLFPFEKITITDFAFYDGMKLKEVKTLWGESLIDFHRKLFVFNNYNMDSFCFYEASIWLKNNGGRAVNYYNNFFLLFICHGLLFENFLLNEEDSEFTKNIVLPAIDIVVKKTGLKPLIIPIGPLDIETDDHWISHNNNIKKIIPIY